VVLYFRYGHIEEFRPFFGRLLHIPHYQGYLDKAVEINVIVHKKPPRLSIPENGEPGEWGTSPFCEYALDTLNAGHS
jgi:hypothetical protein